MSPGIAPDVEDVVGWDEGYVHGILEERRFIGMDLHDSVLQDLCYLQLALGRLHGLMGDGQMEAFLLLKELQTVTAGLVDRTRQLAHGLVDEEASTDLAGIVQRAANRFAGRFAGRVSLNIRGRKRRTPPAMNSQLALIAHELLTNVWKHAAATEVVVGLEYNPARIILLVQDNGRGIGAGREGSGLGLRSVRERARSIGATLTLGEVVGGGTLARVEAPFD